MSLTSDDVVNWELKVGMRGYVVAQVDELLDEVADELDRLGTRVAELELERAGAAHSLQDQLEVEDTLRVTLVQAQEASDQLRAAAHAAANQIIAQAQQEAAAIIDEARHEAALEAEAVQVRLRSSEARLRAAGASLRRELAALQSLEAETRALLRGVYQDRLDALEVPDVEVPDVDASQVDVPQVDDAES